MNEGYKRYDWKTAKRQVERYEPQSPEGRLACASEIVTGRYWGPEHMPESDIARTFNLEKSDISEEEWAEIYEFTVNAGATAHTTMIDTHRPQKIKPAKEEKLGWRIIENKDRFDPYHDIFHAAEVYRESQGKKAAVPIAEVSKRDRYLDPDLYRTELWPGLFYLVKTTTAPLPVSLSSLEGRRQIQQELAPEGVKNPARARIRKILEGSPPEITEEAQLEYETMIGLFLLMNAVEKIKDVTVPEIQALVAEITESRGELSEYYMRFASRVFGKEWKENPRLFLDEFLAAIRTKPEVKEHV
jgi:hypothetical protein